VHVHLPFVVARAAGIDVAIAKRGLKRRSVPFLERIGWLHVIVAIAKHGRLAGSVEPIGIDQRVARGGNDFNMFETGAAEARSNEFGGADHVGFVIGICADARDPQEVEKLIEQARLLLLDEIGDG
jgi:hypothetical protein